MCIFENLIKNVIHHFSFYAHKADQIDKSV